MIYCVEQYKAAKKLNGKQVSELFSHYHVWDYIYSCFEALHTTGSNYIMQLLPLTILQLRLERLRVLNVLLMAMLALWSRVPSMYMSTWVW